MNITTFEMRLEALDNIITLCKKDLQTQEGEIDRIITQITLNDCVEEYDRLVEWGQITFGY